MELIINIFEICYYITQKCNYFTDSSDYKNVKISKLKIILNKKSIFVCVYN